MLNGPANAVKRKPELVAMLARGDIASEKFDLAMLARGDIASEKFDPKVRRVAITGDAGIVMGSEIVGPRRVTWGRLHAVRRSTGDTPMYFYGRTGDGGFWPGTPASYRRSGRPLPTTADVW